MALGFRDTAGQRDNNAMDYMTALCCCCGLNTCVP